MYAILASAARYLLNLLLGVATIKFWALTLIAVVIGWIVQAVLTLIDTSFMSGLSSVFGSLPSSMLYFLGLFRFDYGLPLLMLAWAARFLLRRIPLIG